MGRSGTQYVAMVTELLSSYWRAHLVKSYCKVSSISDTNSLRYLFSSYLSKIWLRVWRHHLANLHILKTWISLERKEIFEHSKQHFSAHEVYVFMFQNGFDSKDAIFVIVLAFVYVWCAYVSVHQASKDLVCIKMNESRVSNSNETAVPGQRTC